jgi:hypothetical protein
MPCFSSSEKCTKSSSERLDAAASGIVPLLYLGGVMAGVAAYFAGITLDIGLAVGISLAAAAEAHSFLQQRRFRDSLARLLKLAPDAEHDDERDDLWRLVWINGGILAALLAFSAYNAIQFAAETWRPTAGFGPAWLQTLVRGLIIPALFFASGFLVPLHADSGAVLADASRDMLRKAIKVMVGQWKGRINAARKAGLDLAPVAIALMEDASDTDGARRIQLIAAGLDAAERRAGKAALTIGAPASAPATNAPAPLPEPPRPSHPTHPTLPNLPAQGAALPRVTVRATDPEGAPAAATAFHLPGATKVVTRVARGKIERPADLRAHREQAARTILIGLEPEARAKLTASQLARQIAIRTQYGCSEHAARAVRQKVESQLATELAAWAAATASDSQSNSRSDNPSKARSENDAKEA